MEFTPEKFRKLFPHLAEELGGEGTVRISGVRSEREEAERAADFQPSAVDFLRRCDTEEEAEEILSYLERRGEITHEYAERLRRQLKERGLRSFGSKKEPGYYFRNRGP
ncbi:MAG: DUF2095 domain-containing protein [Hadesarchaea archaeon]|nr:DUF2095 domain-containing protein [Hadesarchaea archaeon]TDA33415.1 MAG: DUF2095 domain-containing protein [Hadesarchaea archaeon]